MKVLIGKENCKYREQVYHGEKTYNVSAVLAKKLEKAGLATIVKEVKPQHSKDDVPVAVKKVEQKKKVTNAEPKRNNASD